MRVFAVVFVGSLFCVAGAGAQTPPASSQATNPAASSSQPPSGQPASGDSGSASAAIAEGSASPDLTPIDPSKLPTSIGRIRLQLAMKPATKTSGLKIQETIEVVGVAPKVELWNKETAKLATGPVPWGAPTHKDFIDLVTPQEFKNYPFDLNALMQWLMEHLGEKQSAGKQSAE